MSSVIPIPAGATAGLIAVLVAEHLGASEVVGGGVAFGVALVVTFGWAMSDRLPNGGGPM